MQGMETPCGNGSNGYVISRRPKELKMCDRNINRFVCYAKEQKFYLQGGILPPVRVKWPLIWLIHLELWMKPQTIESGNLRIFTSLRREAWYGAVRRAAQRDACVTRGAACPSARTSVPRDNMEGMTPFTGRNAPNYHLGVSRVVSLSLLCQSYVTKMLCRASLYNRTWQTALLILCKVDNGPTSGSYWSREWFIQEYIKDKFHLKNVIGLSRLQGVMLDY